MLITHQKKLISAAMLIALFVLARPAGAAIIGTTYDQYTVFAEGNLTVGVTSGIGTTIGGQIGAGVDVVIGDEVKISDMMGGYAGNVFANDDVVIGDYSYIMGDVIADNVSGGGGTHGVSVGDYSMVGGRIDSGGEGALKANIVIGNWSRTAGSLYAAEDITIGTDADIGSSGNPQDINAQKVITIGTGSVIWRNVEISKTKDLKNSGTIIGSTGTTPVAPNSLTYTTRTAPTFSGSTDPLDNVTANSSMELGPGVYSDLLVKAGQTLTVYHDGATGTYDFQNITLEAGANIAIRSDTGAGEVLIQALESLYTQGANVLGRVGQAQLVVNIGKNVTMTGSGSTIYASLMAYDVTSVITINDNSTILGQVYSKGDIIIGDNVLIPEPGTLILLGLGAASLLARRRRRNRA